MLLRFQHRQIVSSGNPFLLAFQRQRQVGNCALNRSGATFYKLAPEESTKVAREGGKSSIIVDQGESWRVQEGGTAGSKVDHAGDLNRFISFPDLSTLQVPFDDSFDWLPFFRWIDNSMR